VAHPSQSARLESPPSQLFRAVPDPDDGLEARPPDLTWPGAPTSITTCHGHSLPCYVASSAFTRRVQCRDNRRASVLLADSVLLIIAVRQSAPSFRTASLGSPDARTSGSEIALRRSGGLSITAVHKPARLVRPHTREFRPASELSTLSSASAPVPTDCAACCSSHQLLFGCSSPSTVWL
jgi:hypothetical protein